MRTRTLTNLPPFTIAALLCWQGWRGTAPQTVSAQPRYPCGVHHPSAMNGSFPDNIDTRLNENSLDRELVDFEKAEGPFYIAMFRSPAN